MAGFANPQRCSAGTEPRHLFPAHGEKCRQGDEGLR